MCRGFWLWKKIPEREVVHDVLHLLHIVLDTVTPAPQRIILQIEDLEAGVDILDKLADVQRPLIIAQRNGVDSQPRQLFYQRDQRLQVLLDRDMEGVSVLKIDRDCCCMSAWHFQLEW